MADHFKRPRYTTAEEAVSCIRTGDRVFVHSVSMAPHTLINAMISRADELRDVEVIHIHTEGPAPYTNPELAKSFRHNACFVGSNARKAVQQGDADYIPIFLSEVPYLFRRKILPIDVAMITVTPPDQHGYCSLGSSVDVTVAALESAKFIIAEVNPQAPRSLGDGVIHISEIDSLIEVDNPITVVPHHEISEEEFKIGKYIADMVDDGATLQMGIGGVPDAVLTQLTNHKRLGVHTEMFSDGLIDLVKRGVVTGEEKKVLPHKIAACFVMGTQKVYDFLHDNPIVTMKDAAYTNDTSIIRKNPKVTAINSAVEIDLTGQICADTIGPRQFSGVGGQMDFMRGASLSEGGKPIIALQSITKKGVSKIVPFLKEGAGVTTTRAHVHYIVTEYGVVNLYGKNLRQRAKALISIAHPSHRESLEKMAYERFGKL
ncbi:acetyl-CoA hydrolase/transferase family protein [Chondrinema litorale]|uniref:acetyl-CoA hydrolase/transferase family protein n=1 Tax=Chondrinema litorale TaxID=2994555 RepID=UPI002542793E|nr:acetyl-CoA hydrolase/transferase C-terminal domain-containing protein [Chondrinema litorale]UZR94820.1 4-hydroxybutyrate CoA-transferase [Chondrinema litorale]